MLGALIGDIIGSRFEWHNIKTREFDLFTGKCHPTDDSVMSLAVAWALLKCDADPEKLGAEVIKQMRTFGRHYPDAGFGGRFRQWLAAEDPQPYQSWGNGAPMRVSPCAYAARTLEEAKALARIVTNVTHDHPESILASEAMVTAIWLAREGKTLAEIRAAIEKDFYRIDFTLDEIRDEYKFDVSCRGSVPQALEAFFESTGFEDAIRNAVSIGGDSDTIASMTGAVAGAYWGIPDEIRREALEFLDAPQFKALTAFEARWGK